MRRMLYVKKPAVADFSEKSRTGNVVGEMNISSEKSMLSAVRIFGNKKEPGGREKPANAGSPAKSDHKRPEKASKNDE